MASTLFFKVRSAVMIDFFDTASVVNGEGDEVVKW
jgi:hypothetical protein